MKHIKIYEEFSPMTIQEFYNGIVNMYNKTGQGIPIHLFREKGCSSLIEELVSQDICKVVNGEWLCLTKGYCVEEDMKGRDIRALMFMRAYKNIKDSSKFSVPKEEVIKLKEYKEWLNKNKSKLEEKIPDKYPGNPDHKSKENRQERIEKQDEIQDLLDKLNKKEKFTKKELIEILNKIKSLNKNRYERGRMHELLDTFEEKVASAEKSKK